MGAGDTGRMEIARTPAERFDVVEGFDHTPDWVEVDAAAGLRMAYVTAGPADGPVVVLVHGEPTWGYLYRRMVGPLADAGLRVVVPDLVGCGRSDKPVARDSYSYAAHVEWLRTALFDGLGLRDVHYVGQDWGGLLGMRLLAEHPDLFAGVVMSNTGLPTGDRPMPEAWQQFRQMVSSAPALDVGRMVDSGCRRTLTDTERASYAAPFPTEEYCAGIRVFPDLVPNTPDDPAAPANRAAWERLATLEVPFLTAFSDGDPITRGGDRWIQSRIPGAQGRSHAVIEGAGHFVQEDQPERFAEVVADFVTHL